MLFDERRCDHTKKLTWLCKYENANEEGSNYNKGVETDWSSLYTDDDDWEDDFDVEDEPIIIDWLDLIPNFDLSKTKSIHKRLAKQA